jgi:hypothetical protein
MEDSTPFPSAPGEFAGAGSVTRARTVPPPMVRGAALVPHANGDVRVPEELSPAHRFEGAEFVSDLQEMAA